MRRRLRWRQADLAARAITSQQTVSLIERGHLESVSLRLLRRTLRALDAQVLLDVRWRGGELDRVLDEGHARLVTAVAERLRSLGWEVHLEVTYSVFGERGSIDVVAWRGAQAHLILVEVKTDITSAEATLRKHDEKVRLGRRIVDERFRWQPMVVSRLLVLPETRTARRRVAAADGLIARTYWLRGPRLRSWLCQPGESIAGVLFLPVTNGRCSSRRVEGPGRRIDAGRRRVEHEPGAG